MKKTQETLQLKNIQKAAVLYIAFELSNSKWKLAFSDGNQVRYLLGALRATVSIDGAPLLTGSPKHIPSAFSIRCLTKSVSTDRSW